MGETLKMNTALVLLNKRYWLAHFLIVAAICIAGLFYLGGATYIGARRGSTSSLPPGKQ